MKWTPTEIALLGMATTLTVAILGCVIAYLASKRERRRQLYGEAVQAIVSWGEMLYRVRRREESQACELINSFHDLQDKLSFYEAWIGSESRYTSRSYSRLVREVKTACEPLIRDAWEKPVRPVPGNAIADDVHPALKPHVDAFLADVRSHLSPLPWRKAAVAWRNRERKAK